MAEIIRMPKMSDTMEEGVIAAWLKKVGDDVKSGDILAEVETDKATMELESYEDGTLLHIGIEEKASVPVDGLIAIIGKKGEDISALLSGAASTPEVVASTPVTQEEAPQAVENIDVSGIKATVINMPKMSDTMTEGTIAQWLKKVGDDVKSGDILAEVETDKATMELESYEDGTLLYVGPKDGESVEVDGVLAIVGEKGADYELLLKAEASKGAAATVESPVSSSQPVVEQPKKEVQPLVNTSSGTIESSNGRVKASPLAKKLALDKGVDITQIQGSGENGRVVKRDVEHFVPAQVAPSTISTPQAVGQESFEEVPLSQMRKVIAKRLSESKFTAPHFYLTMEINMDKTMEARKNINEISPDKISFNDFVIKATAAALRKHPDVNVSWQGDTLRKNHHIHIGVAVAVDEGLLVPVVRFADNKSLSAISSEVKALAKNAADKKLQPADWEGNTFTISNLGMYGIEEFTAIVNPPDACILAVGGIKQTAIVKNGQLVPGNVMKVTLSCDHRAVDGAVGAAFLHTLKGLLEDPVRILL
ncbi:MAG: pyruvate dehydrogenase complex dihydrolipoamide acetyltransferase [Cyclobacteriaceae bacterium]|nr:pyruvate dehydrogenase complex dihydrolipoamide acetyltransferase [Cyclobacteriaceae bacterium]